MPYDDCTTTLTKIINSANSFIIFCRAEGVHPVPPVSTISALCKTAASCRVEPFWLHTEAAATNGDSCTSAENQGQCCGLILVARTMTMVASLATACAIDRRGRGSLEGRPWHCSCRRLAPGLCTHVDWCAWAGGQWAHVEMAAPLLPMPIHSCARSIVQWPHMRGMRQHCRCAVFRRGTERGNCVALWVTRVCGCRQRRMVGWS